MVAILEVMIEDKKLEGRTINGKPAREVIERRNNRIIKLFKHHGISVRLIGDMEKPAIILDETWCLSCWARNFDLILNTAPRGGNTIETIKLTDKIEDSDILVAYVQNELYHRRVYRVELENTGLYLAGYNFKNRKDSTGRYPVFARVHPKIYYSESKAQELVDELCMENYTTNII